VLMIVGLLLGGMLVPLSAQMDQRNVTDTRKQLDEIQQALIGFAIVNGRLPCPASPTSNGVESFVSGGASGGYCSNFNNGFVPAATLGITSTVDNQGNTGFAVDSWGNRIRYAVTSSNGYAFTETNGMSTVGMSSLAPNLIVCSTASGATSSSCASGPPSTALTSSPGVPVVIYSTGKNGASGGASGDEAENPNPNSPDNDRVFVSHDFTPTFDDLVVWISPNILFNRMVAAGKLP